MACHSKLIDRPVGAGGRALALDWFCSFAMGRSGTDVIVDSYVFDYEWAFVDAYVSHDCGVLVDIGIDDETVFDVSVFTTEYFEADLFVDNEVFINGATGFRDVPLRGVVDSMLVNVVNYSNGDNV
ncbi:hypothetical protein NDU88_007582 [Pleurodeles waltl]|uniref:Uncharacterized protein n=1 Tax=Pleurodeles waltl TaxID=8319 RepID=A0AAV7RRD3_PLEWA|nr:hypothetical protein NDU88_007582 [Pleurodeles waltl]